MNVSGYFLQALNTLDPTLLFVNFQDNIVVSESESTPKPQEFPFSAKRQLQVQSLAHLPHLFEMSFDQVKTGCVHCGHEMSNFGEVFEHLSSRRPNHLHFIKPSQSAGDSNLWCCYKCKGWLGIGHKGFRSPEEMMSHLRKHHRSSLDNAKTNSKAEPLILMQGNELLTQLLSGDCEPSMTKPKE